MDMTQFTKQVNERLSIVGDKLVGYVERGQGSGYAYNKWQKEFNLLQALLTHYN